MAPNPIKSLKNKVHSAGTSSPASDTHSASSTTATAGDASTQHQQAEESLPTGGGEGDVTDGLHSNEITSGPPPSADQQRHSQGHHGHPSGAGLNLEQTTSHGSGQSASRASRHADDLRHKLAHLMPHGSRKDIDRTSSLSPSGSGAASPTEPTSPGSGRSSLDLFKTRSVGHGPAGSSLMSRFKKTRSPSPESKHQKLQQEANENSSHHDEASERKKQKEAARAERRRHEEEEHERNEQIKEEHYQADPLKDHYGLLPITSLSETRQDVIRHKLDDIASMPDNTETSFRARVHHIRPISARVAFIVLRQGLSTIQTVLAVKPDAVSENMVRWSEHLSLETVVVVHGYVHEPKSKDKEIHSCTIHNREVHVDRIHIAGTVTTTLPFHVEDVERPSYLDREDEQQAKAQAAVGNGAKEEDQSADSSSQEKNEPNTVLNKHNRASHAVGYSTRLDNRVIDLRSDVSQAIFRIGAGVTRFFRQHLDNNGFVEIHTSKFQGGATESGASVFKVDYFGRPAFMAQSPQLGKQMAIAADMERVYEIGPVFRAENSNTHRHLTEFTGLDMEMAIDDHYHEVIDMLDGCFLNIFRGLQTHFRRELDTVRKMYPSEDLVFPDKTLRLHFHDAVQMLRDSGWTDEGEEIDFFEDFSTRTERRLGELVKEQYNTDYYILDKFPASARPFYTMPDPNDPRRSNSCDFFIRGEEILSGGQRIHQAPLLIKRMKDLQMDPSSMTEYIDSFRLGCPPHGGGGIGLERVIFLFLKLGNIRWATMFPRDPRSFPLDPNRASLPPPDSMARGPTADTLAFVRDRLDGKKPALPMLEDLIAAYGDSPNTSWLDPFWTVWRDVDTGAAIGYAKYEKHAVCWGRPLCDNSQILAVMQNFLAHLKSLHLKPVMACIDSATERVLEEKMNWSCVVAVAEQRVDPVTLAAERDDKTVRQKIHRAQREGVKIVEKDDGLSEEEQTEVRQRMKEWQEHRHGTQVYSAGLRPFDDPEHRKYFLARDKDNHICGLVVLAQLAREHGYQVKYSLDFPNAPPGTIELIVSEALTSLGRSGVHAATFGGSAPEQIQPMGNEWGMKVKMLTKSYSMITKSFRLTDKATFRSKFGTTADPQYVAYPKGGLGLKGIEAIMKVLQSEK